MIPKKLQLKNFLSYGPTVQTIDFGQHRLICLSGKNGHGKSALLDAITWALWGQARKVSATSKADQGLLRLGEVEMMVCFDFVFGNRIYRVRRDFSQKYGKPHTHLEFGLLDPEDEHFISLTDKTLRTTQEKVEKTLGLDYDTFVNSSFLRQGNANEFSKKSAKERKEILCTILGLHTYEKARASVLETIKTLATEKQHLERLKELCTQEYTELSYVPTQQAVITDELTQNAAHQTELTKELTILAARQKQVAEQQESYNMLAFSHEQELKQETTYRAQLRELVQQWKTTHQQLLTLKDPQELEKEHLRISTQVEQFQKALQTQFTLKEQILHKKESLATLKTSLELEHRTALHTKQLELERSSTIQTTVTSALALCSTKKQEASRALAYVTNTIAQHRKELPASLLVAEKAEIQIQFERRKSLYQKWVEQGNWVNNELKQVVHKESLSQDTTNPSCPLCEQNLSQARKRFLHKKFSDHSHLLTRRFNRIKTGLEKLKIVLHAQHKHLQVLELLEKLTQQEREHTALHNGYQEEYKELLTKKEQLLKDQATLQQECITLETATQQILLKHPHYSDLLATLATLEKELQETHYDGLIHKQVVADLKQIEDQKTLHGHFLAQKAIQKERQVTIHSLCTILKDLRTTASHTLKKLEDSKNIHTQAQTLKTQAVELQARIAEYAALKEQLFQKKGHLEALQQKRQQVENQAKEQTKQCTDLATTMYDMHLVANAFGKDGIQALLIEDAIPEIEQEANSLLARLTENQASIAIESLRDLKKGGTRETLDINISDASGIRPYEMFSGGEAFRIDFALRIAISKLLARRAGTSLQTLIIDEGFGSQDEEGLQRIMDSLYSIQEDFEKIIIVSHLPSMKEQFPVHFYIQKDPQGSRVTVLEQE